jgi:hypothetical protein
MPNCRNKQFRVMVMVAAIIGLAACAAVTTPPSKETSQARFQETVQALLANQAAGSTATLAGTGFVTGPIAVPLANGEVTMVPLTPELDKALAGLQRQWVDGKRQPLSFDTYRTAVAILTAHRIAVAQVGGEALIRFARTDEKGNFRFEGVPEGSWLLLADLRSSVSILLWAYPVTVRAQRETPPIFLTDGNLLLEARLAPGDQFPLTPTSPDPPSTVTGQGGSFGP